MKDGENVSEDNVYNTFTCNVYPKNKLDRKFISSNVLQVHACMHACMHAYIHAYIT